MKSYVTLDVVKSDGGLKMGTGTGEDTRLRILTEAVTQAMDNWMGRTFQSYLGTLTFDGDGSQELLVPDLVSIDGSGLKIDSNLDGTFDEVWATTDFILYPLNAAPGSAQNPRSRPYQSIQVDLKAGSQDVFTKGQQSVQIAGEWGYWKHLTTATAVGSADIATADVLIGIVTGTDVKAGHTILIDSEQMYVEGTGTDGTLLTVLRSVNSTTAGSHGSGAVIQYFNYPAPISEIALIETGKLWRRKDSSYASSIGFPETGEMQIIRGFDRDTRMIMSPFKKMTV